MIRISSKKDRLENGTALNTKKLAQEALDRQGVVIDWDLLRSFQQDSSDAAPFRSDSVEAYLWPHIEANRVRIPEQVCRIICCGGHKS